MSSADRRVEYVISHRLEAWRLDWERSHASKGLTHSDELETSRKSIRNWDAGRRQLGDTESPASRHFRGEAFAGDDKALD